jgi:hypothetical protein
MDQSNLKHRTPGLAQLKGLDAADVAQAILPHVDEDLRLHGGTREPYWIARSLAERSGDPAGSSEIAQIVMEGLQYLIRTGLLTPDMAGNAERYRLSRAGKSAVNEPVVPRGGAMSRPQSGDPIRDALNVEQPLVFISHIHEEQDLAIALKEAIETGFPGMFSIFVSSDSESIASGQRWLDSITSALKSASAQIVLSSPLSLQRSWIHFEAGSAWVRDIPVVPVCHSGMHPGELPIPLRLLQSVLATDVASLRTMFSTLANLVDAPVPDSDLEHFAARAAAFTSVPRVDNTAKTTGTVARAEESYESELEQDEAYFSTFALPIGTGSFRLRVFPTDYQARGIDIATITSVAANLTVGDEQRRMPYASDPRSFQRFKWGVQRFNNGIAHPAYRDMLRFNCSGLFQYRRWMTEDFDDSGTLRHDGDRYVGRNHLVREVKMLFSLASVYAAETRGTGSDSLILEVSVIGNNGRYMIDDEQVGDVPRSSVTPSNVLTSMCQVPDFVVRTELSRSEIESKSIDLTTRILDEIQMFYEDI